MRRSLTILLAASVTSAGLSGCVQTKQYADLQFTPPQGDYRLLVLRPDVSVGLATTGGIFEQRADWTDAARTAILASLRAQQGARGGQLLIADRRTAVPGVDATTVAELERLNSAVDQAIAEHKYGGQYLPTKRRLGLDYTLGEDAVTFGRKTGFDYMMFLHAEDEIASTGRVAMQIVGLAGCIIGFCAPSGGSGQLAYASLVDLRTGEVVWFNVLQTGSQIPGMGFGDIRTQAGADQMVERLLGRMKPGRNVQRAAAVRP